jgi:hypothetical protein
MTKRLSAGVVLAASAVLLTALAADAKKPGQREWRGKEDPNALPLFFRSGAGTTWVDVGQSCANEDTLNSSHSPNQVWCFEGANGDSTWPLAAGQGDGDFDHWALFDPPNPSASKWHVSTRFIGTGGGTYNAFCGCFETDNPAGCTDVNFWSDPNNHEGYGDDWDYSLILEMDGRDAEAGGMITFDLRYDAECDYDYTYLEYFRTDSLVWRVVVDTAGNEARFNAVSGNKDTAHGGQGRVGCGDDLFFHSDQVSGDEYHGNSIWLTDVSFPLPAQSGGIRLRWHCTSDQGWSDADGQGDTDGIAAIDNVEITFDNEPGAVIADNFESGSFRTFGNDSAMWTAGTLEAGVGALHDGWHMRFDPKYTNKGNTCTFSNDWMYDSKPGGPIPVNGFNYLLVTPKIACSGWTAGLVEYSGYLCANGDWEDGTDTLMRVYNSAQGGWGLWQSFDGNTYVVGGCEFWNMNDFEELNLYLDPNDVDSLQFCWVQMDVSSPGDFYWDAPFHGGIIYVIDNVSIGNYDATSTIFTWRSIDLFSDTFSRVDPAHTPFMANSAEGRWAGNGGTRNFAAADSMAITVDDVNGIPPNSVKVYWRVGSGTPASGFTAWANKDMVFRVPSPGTTSKEGTYRTTFGNTSTERYSSDADLPNGATPIWNLGATIQYYVHVTDSTGAVTVFPASVTDATPTYLQWNVLPQGRTIGSDGEGARNVLVVDDYGRNNLDFENSNEFDATGGVGFGTFADPVNDSPSDQIEQALALIYGGSEEFEDGVYGSPKWDVYNVGHAGFNVQREPRVTSFQDDGLFGIGDDSGAPVYDAVIWLTGSFDGDTFQDSTRLALYTWLDQGGHLLANGNDIAYHLGVQDTTPSAATFLSDYLGIAFDDPAFDETATRRLDVHGVASTSLAGLRMGLYGECPGIRMAFDRLAVDSSQTGVTALATYQNSGAGTNGIPAIIKKVNTSGVAVTCGFGMESLVNDIARACLIGKVFTGDFGINVSSGFVCVNSGTDAPVIASSRFGFDLAQASPNPFSDATSIHFSVPARTHVSIEVYNILGQRVRNLVDETLEANSYVREWDGRADGGARVSSGIYFYKMVAGDFTATRKAVVLK